MFLASTSIKFANSAGASAGFAHAQWQQYQFGIARNTLKLCGNASVIGSDANGVITELEVIEFPPNVALVFTRKVCSARRTDLASFVVSFPQWQ